MLQIRELFHAQLLDLRLFLKKYMHTWYGTHYQSIPCCDPMRSCAILSEIANLLFLRVRRFLLAFRQVPLLRTFGSAQRRRRPWQKASQDKYLCLVPDCWKIISPRGVTNQTITPRCNKPSRWICSRVSFPITISFSSMTSKKVSETICVRPLGIEPRTLSLRGI